MTERDSGNGSVSSATKTKSNVDWTVHVTESGDKLSTQERVIKGIADFFFSILKFSFFNRNYLLHHIRYLFFFCSFSFLVSPTWRLIISNWFRNSDVVAPAVCRPTDEQFWSKKVPGKPDLEFLKNHFAHEGRLSEEHALWIINKATEILKKESNLLEVEAPVTGKTIFLNLFPFFRGGNLK